MNRNGALAGMITGAVTVVVWKQLTVAGIIPFELYEIVPGFILATIAIIVFSLTGNEPRKIIKEEFVEAVENDIESR
jgi:sodium/proline symporter